MSNFLLASSTGLLYEDDTTGDFQSLEDGCPPDYTGTNYPTVRVVFSGVSVNTGCETHDFGFGILYSRNVSGGINGTTELPTDGSTTWDLDTSVESEALVTVKGYSDAGCGTLSNPFTRFLMSVGTTGGTEISVHVQASAASTAYPERAAMIFTGSVDLPLNCRCRTGTSFVIPNVYTEYGETFPGASNFGNRIEGKNGTCTVEFLTT